MTNDEKILVKNFIEVLFDIDRIERASLQNDKQRTRLQVEYEQIKKELGLNDN